MKAVSDERVDAVDVVAVKGGEKTEKGEQGASSAGLSITRHFTKSGVDPFDEVEWEIRSALIANEKGDRKSTRLNSSHVVISYAVFCLKKKKIKKQIKK